MVRDVARQRILDELCSPQRGVNCDTLEAVITLAVELAREGREGRKIGTLFVIADHEAVLAQSRPMILDPLAGHEDAVRNIRHPDMRETLKELALLDGAFVVRDDGVVISGCRYIDASSQGIRLPLGLGSRHMAAASITKQTRAVAVVVSESAVVRIFDDGELTNEIIPELWMLSQYRTHLAGPTSQQTADDLTVLSREEK